MGISIFLVITVGVLLLLGVVEYSTVFAIALFSGAEDMVIISEMSSMLSISDRPPQISSDSMIHLL